MIFSAPRAELGYKTDRNIEQCQNNIRHFQWYEWGDEDLNMNSRNAAETTNNGKFKALSLLIRLMAASDTALIKPFTALVCVYVSNEAFQSHRKQKHWWHKAVHSTRSRLVHPQVSRFPRRLHVTETRKISWSWLCNRPSNPAGLENKTYHGIFYMSLMNIFW